MVAEAQTIAPMTQEEFDAAKHVTLDPIECLRCGRWLTSRASITRGYGMSCAFTQALEELSHQGRNPRKAFSPKPIVEFYEVTEDLWEVVDHRELVIGQLHRTRTGAWMISLWDKKVDLDADLGNAKRRVSRIIERMGR